jgi:hypothetical protein
MPTDEFGRDGAAATLRRMIEDLLHLGALKCSAVP